MKKTTYTRDQLLVQSVFVTPFVLAVIMLIINLATISDISLLPSFNINFTVVILFVFVHLSLIIAIIKWKKIDMRFPKINSLMKFVVSILIILILTASSFLFVMSFKMNFNYWLRSDSIQSIELTVKNKYVSTGKTTDYYIFFTSKYGNYSNKVHKKNYYSYVMGERLNVIVNKGYFEGYFLTNKLK